jgi:hypothetical protein
MFGRKIPDHGDGINHQAGGAVFLDGVNLTKKKDYWLTTSHSFGNSIIKADDDGSPVQRRGIEGEGDGSSEQFFAMDLGDANPRSIHLMRFFRKLSAYTFQSDGKYSWQMTGKSVYHYKVKPAPSGYAYNNVYSELGHPGIVEVDDGLLVFFVGENPPLDNSMANPLIDQRRWRPDNPVPRNVAFVKVSSDLRTIMSPGARECTGSQFGNLCNTGVNFITNYSSPHESASRLKTFKLPSGRILLTYEIWNQRKYARTEMMEVDKDGNVVRGKWDSCVKMRLLSDDEPVVIKGKGIAYAGSAEGLVRYEICAGDECN